MKQLADRLPPGGLTGKTLRVLPDEPYGGVDRLAGQIRAVGGGEHVGEPVVTAVVGVGHVAVGRVASPGAVGPSVEATVEATVSAAVAAAAEGLPGKPNPDTYQYAAELLGLPSEECVVVADVRETLDRFRRIPQCSFKRRAACLTGSLAALAAFQRHDVIR